MSRRGFLGGAAVAAGASVLRPAAVLAASPGLASSPSDVLTSSFPADAARHWVDVAYGAVLRENLSPPAAARAYAHVAVAMYEAARIGIPASRSLAEQLTGLTALPPPVHRGNVDWPSVLAQAAYAALGRVLPFQDPATRPGLDDALAAFVAGRRSAGVKADTLARSAALADGQAGHLAAWTASDGYAGIVDLPYTPPVGPSLWESTPPNFRPAVEPYWSRIRPMVLRSADEVEPAPHLPFDPDPASPFGLQAMAPYEQSFRNTAEERTIARFWTDNPGSFTPPLGTQTGLPSGHWMQITSIALRDTASDLAVAVEAYARVGIALHEAFLNCWTWKYRFNLLRPVTYIRRYVDPAWSTFVNSPQFPEYTSGHSVASPAAAAGLTLLFGHRAFVDDSAVPRGFAARSFTSFDDAADEAARSRLYGGIHYPMAIEEGLRQGEAIGRLVNERLVFRR